MSPTTPDIVIEDTDTLDMNALRKRAEARIPAEDVISIGDTNSSASGSSTSERMHGDGNELQLFDDTKKTQ